MSSVEAPMFVNGHDRLAPKEPSDPVNGPVTILERAWIWGINLRHAGRAAYGDEVARRESENGSRRHGITIFGKSVEGSDGFPGIDGMEDFTDTVQSVINPPRLSHVLVVASHPELLRSGSKYPLWPSVALSAMGEIMGEDPYLFIKEQFVLVCGRWANLLPVGSKGNEGILETSRRVLQQARPQAFVIFPEGTSRSDDCMVQARSGGTLALLEAAVDRKVPLSVIPVALNQRTVSRGETIGNDKYEMRTGIPRLANELLPPSYGGSIEERRAVIHRLMTDVAEMMPSEKQGYYKERVDERREARVAASRIPQVVYEAA